MESKGTLKLEQQQFNSSLKAALYTATGKEVIYVPGYYAQRKPKALASSQVLYAHPSPSEGRAESGDPVEELSSEKAAEFNVEAINEINEGEPLNPINVEGADALLSDHATQPNPDLITTKSPPIISPNYEEANKEFGNSIPISVIMPKLIDIQVREINEALMT